MLKKLVIGFFLVSTLIPVKAFSEFSYTPDQSIPVENANGELLFLPWAGGLNAAQFNTMDINADGKDDLVIFERMANHVLTYLNVNNSYQYAPEYEILFPEEITNRMLLRDFYCDGKKNIFTGDIFGMKVYVNVAEPTELIHWKPFFFYTGNYQSQSVLTKGFSGKINLQL